MGSVVHIRGGAAPVRDAYPPFNIAIMPSVALI